MNIFKKISNLFTNKTASSTCTCPQYKAGNNINISNDVISTPATVDKE